MNMTSLNHVFVLFAVAVDEESDVVVISDDESDADELAWVCERCDEAFSSQQTLARHIEREVCRRREQRSAASDTLHDSDVDGFVCRVCSATFENELVFSSHELLHSHPDEVYRNGSYTLSLFQCSRHRSVRDYMLESSDPIPDLESLLLNNVGIIENMFDVMFYSSFW